MLFATKCQRIWLLAGGWPQVGPSRQWEESAQHCPSRTSTCKAESRAGVEIVVGIVVCEDGTASPCVQAMPPVLQHLPPAHLAILCFLWAAGTAKT